MRPRTETRHRRTTRAAYRRFAILIPLALALLASVAEVSAQAGCTLVDLGGGWTSIDCPGRPQVTCVDLGGGFISCN